MNKYDNDNVYKETIKYFEKKMSLSYEQEKLLLHELFRLLYELKSKDLLIDTFGNKKNEIDLKLIFSFMSNIENLSYLIKYCKINSLNLEFLRHFKLKDLNLNFSIRNFDENIKFENINKLNLDNKTNFNEIYLIPVVNLNTIYDKNMYKEIEIKKIIIDYIEKETLNKSFSIIKIDYIKDELGNLIAITTISD